jgi:hypothetical protein
VKPGDWVRFWTRNWPDHVRAIGFTVGSPGTGKDVTGQGPYLGRGRILRITENGAILVREERGERLVEVAPGERIEPLVMETCPLTLGELRRFLEECKEAPDDTPVNVSLPVEFNCDDGELEMEAGHPERHEPNSFEDVPPSASCLRGLSKGPGTLPKATSRPTNKNRGKTGIFPSVSPRTGERRTTP